MLVVDASAMTELLVARPAGERIAREFIRHDHDLHAPHLIDVEVLSALRRLVALGHAPDAVAVAALTDLLDLPLDRYPHDVLAGRIWQLRDNFTAYDAAYLALAEALAPRGARLITADARFARAVERHGEADVILAG